MSFRRGTPAPPTEPLDAPMSHPDLPLRGIDHVRFFVGNARQSAYFYRNAFGFDVVAYAARDPDRYSPRTYHPAGMRAIDHIVGNVEEGKMDEWVRFYQEVMGFSQLVSFDDKDISTDYSALMSKVVQGGGGRIKFPINEPAKSRRRSQIEEYLNFYRGPGVQHIALATDNIMETVRALRHNDVSFLKVPKTYYEMLPARVGT